MANDRVFAVCKTCGSHALLFKYYPSGGYVPWTLEDYSKWWNEHLHNAGMSIPLSDLPELMTEENFYEREVVKE